MRAISKHPYASAAIVVLLIVVASYFSLWPDLHIGPLGDLSAAILMPGIAVGLLFYGYTEGGSESPGDLAGAHAVLIIVSWAAWTAVAFPLLWASLKYQRAKGRRTDHEG